MYKYSVIKDFNLKNIKNRLTETASELTKAQKQKTDEGLKIIKESYIKGEEVKAKDVDDSYFVVYCKSEVKKDLIKHINKYTKLTPDELFSGFKPTLDRIVKVIDQWEGEVKNILTSKRNEKYK